jgi:hypothetical protein
MNELDDLYSALKILYARLGTLASINNAGILNLQAHYHEIVEEAGVALGQVETIVDALRAEFEYQHRRLDEARDAALKEAIEGFHQE